MKKEILISVFLGVLYSSMVADSLKLNPPQFMARFNPCPDNFTGNLPNPDDCHSFYICHEGRGEVFPCGEFCYNPANDQCDFCEAVPGCGGSGTRPPPSSSPSPSSTTTAAPPSSSSSAPSPTTSAQTNPPPSSTPQGSTTTPGGGDLPCPDLPFIYMPLPGDCTKFYYCVEGANTGIFTCGPGLWFNFQMQACVPPWGDSCN